MAESTGIAPEAALGRPIAQVLPDATTGDLVDVLRRVVEHGTVEVRSAALHGYLIACPPGTPSAAFDRMQQHVSIGPLREDGRITGAVITIEDVTDRAEPNGARGAAEAMARALGDPQWTARRREVGRLASGNDAVVAALVQTIREQHQNFNVLSSALDLLAIADLDVIDPLIACLADDDVNLRVQTALILGQQRDRRAVPALMRALDDPDANVRFHAIEALGRLHATEAVDALLRIAETRDFFLSFPAIQALTGIADASAARRLVPLLGDELLTPAVVEMLGEVGDDVVAEPLAQLLCEPGAPVETIAEALAALHDRYEDRYGAGDHIATIVGRTVTADVTRQLLDAVDRVSSDRLRGLTYVLSWVSGPEPQRALARMLGQATVRAQVVEALVRHGSGVVDLLVDQLNADDLETRQAAAVALGRIGDRRATPALVAALDDRELTVAAASALARVGDAMAFDALIRFLGDPDSVVRHATIAALNSIGHSEMPRRVLALLDDGNPLVRESAVRIAGYFGYRECLAAMLDRCSDPTEAVRRAAVEQLPMFDDRRAADRLALALAADTPVVRAAAAMAMGRADADVAVSPLLAALADPDPWVRHFAVRSLGAFPRQDAAAAVRERLDHDAAGQVRLAAIEVLGRLQPAGVLSMLEPFTMAVDADEARAAIRAIRHVRDSRADVLLERLLHVPDAWRRLEAAAAIGQRGGDIAVDTLQWTAAADESIDVAHAAVAGLALTASRDGASAAEATRALLALTAEPSRRAPAVAALSRLPVGSAGVVAEGLAHASPVVRRSTVEALSRMRHTDASRFIENALNDPASTVRATAVAELRRLGSRHAVRKLAMLANSDPDPSVRHAAMAATSKDRQG